MNHTSFKIAAAALAVASALSSTAYAGGFQLTEQSALGLGRACAGVGVDGTDVSGMYYNAAFGGASTRPQTADILTSDRAALERALQVLKAAVAAG